MSEIVSKINAEAQFQFNRGTAEEWAQNDIVLAEGEPALLLDGDGETLEVRYGDGKKKFSELKPPDANVDSDYNPESDNAQSGKAVAEAIKQSEDSLKSFANQTFAPVIKQNISGNPIIVNVSPIEHELKIKVKSKNLLPQPLNVTLPYTQNGVTVSEISEGVSLDGSLTGPNAFAFSLGTVTLPAGTYMLGGLIDIGTKSETSNIYLTFPDSFSGSITLTEEKTVSIQANIGHYEEKTIKVDAFVYPVVISKEYVNGYSFNEYIPYNMDFSNVSVRKYGSNLLNINTDKFYTSASTIQVLENKVRVTKTAASKWCCARWVLPVTVAELDKQRIYFQGTVSRNSGIRVCIGYSYADGTNYTNIAEKTAQDFSMYMDIDASNTTYQHISIQLYVDVSTEGAVGDYTEFSNLRVTVGQNVYTPYIEPQTAQSDKEGVVSGLTSLSPNIILVTDNPDVTLECEYNADTKMYIDNKFAELSAAILNL